MAKRKHAGFSVVLGGGHSHDGDDFAVHHAYHTLKDAHKIIGDKGLMNKVKLHHQKLKADHANFEQMTGRLMKMGRISTKSIQRHKVKLPKPPK